MNRTPPTIETDFADAQTLRDLSIFPDDRGSLSLLTLLDHTRTSAGREALRHFLATAKGTVGAIEETQQTLRYFSSKENRDDWDFRASDRGLTYVEKYMESYIHPLEGRRGLPYVVRSFWYRANYRKYSEHLDSCVRRTHRFVLGIDALVRRVSPELPHQLDVHLDQFKKLLADSTVQDLIQRGGTDSRFKIWDVLYFDQFLRRETHPLLRSALNACSEIDAWKSLGVVTEGAGFTFPRFARSPDSGDSASENLAPLDAKGIYHPFLENPVENDIRIDTERNFVFLTGPNMAGKTTFMKSLGLCVYLAHLGMAVPAREFVLPFFDKMRSSLNVLDNIEKGYSYYYTEVDRVRTVAEHLRQGENVFVLFDELFKGTNMKDAVDGSSLVIRGFLRFPKSRFVVSSHLVEIEEKLTAETRAPRSPTGDTKGQPSTSQVQYAFFESEVIDGKPSFSYRLRAGVSTERLGLLILQNEGVDKLLGVDF